MPPAARPAPRSPVHPAPRALARSPARTRIAAGIGGTFTDVAAFDEQRGVLLLGKTLTTPQRLIDGILDGMQKAGVTLAETNLFLHGSTVAINTMLERSGARAALITTRGFRDIYEIGRINRPDSFNLRHAKHAPLIERDLRFEVSERLMADGTVYQALNMSEVEAIADDLARRKIEAVAILFLHSYRNPAHEHAVKRYLQQRLPGVFITASSDLSQEYREYERTSTVAANAYIGPRVDRYLGEIEMEMQRAQFNGKFLVVQSTGGLYALAEARQDCVRMMESGPAAGVIGTQALCHLLGIDNAIAFDMGGTTAKAGVVRAGAALVAGSAMIGGYFTGLPLLTPMIDIHEVGTGGGSIAAVSASGALRVGPHSPDRAAGDLEAQLSACRTGVKHMEAMLARHGAAAMQTCIEAIMHHSEMEARARVRAMPDGVYEAESWMNDDAVDIDQPVPVRVKVTIAGDSMTVDLSDMSPQVKGFYNSGAGVVKRVTASARRAGDCGPPHSRPSTGAPGSRGRARRAASA